MLRAIGAMADDHAFAAHHASLMEGVVFGGKLALIDSTAVVQGIATRITAA
jgi:hypothetical protein